MITQFKIIEILFTISTQIHIKKYNSYTFANKKLIFTFFKINSLTKNFEDVIIYT